MPERIKAPLPSSKESTPISRPQSSVHGPRSQRAHDGVSPAFEKGGRPLAPAGLAGFGDIPLMPRAESATLTLGSRHDPAEAEADQAAARLGTRLSMPWLPAEPAMRAPATHRPRSGQPVAPQISDEIQAARGHGQSLSDGVLGGRAGELGVSPAKVGIHTDARADRLAHQLHARAFTVGTDIFFRQGEFAPTSPRGSYVLAHELAHASQPDAAGGSSVIQPLDEHFNLGWAGAFFKKARYGSELTDAVEAYWEALSKRDDSALSKALAELQDWIERSEEDGIDVGNGVKEWSAFKKQVSEELKGAPNQKPANRPPPQRPNKDMSELEELYQKWVAAAQTEQDELALSLGRCILYLCAHWEEWAISQIKQSVAQKKDLDPQLPKIIRTVQAYEQQVAPVQSAQLTAQEALDFEQRQRIHVDMGQGATGNLNRVVLTSTDFDTCLPVVMYNQENGMGGLFHVSAGQAAIDNQVLQMISMAKHIQATWIGIYGGGGDKGSSKEDVQLIYEKMSASHKANYQRMEDASSMLVTMGNKGPYMGPLDRHAFHYNMADITGDEETHPGKLSLEFSVYTSPEVVHDQDMHTWQRKPEQNLLRPVQKQQPMQNPQQMKQPVKQQVAQQQNNQGLAHKQQDPDKKQKKKK